MGSWAVKRGAVGGGGGLHASLAASPHKRRDVQRKQLRAGAQFHSYSARLANVPMPSETQS